MRFTIAACAATVLLATPARATTPPSGRAILVHLPGASGAELARYEREGLFGEGGFRLFFERGEVGPGLRPVDPTLPTASLIALSSGRKPGEVGVVAGRLPGSGDPGAAEAAEVDPLPAGVDSLAAAVVRAGGRVGAVLWPGLDNRALERRAEWGLADRDTTGYPSRSLKLTRSEWTDERYGLGPGPSLYWALPPTVRSYSTPLTTATPFQRPHQRADKIYELVAIDRTDDGVENYDGILVSSNVDPKKGFVGIAEPGAWFRLELGEPGADRRSSPEVAWIKVMELQPDLSAARIYVSGTAFARAYPASLVRALAAEGWEWAGRLDEAALVEGLAGGYGIDEQTFVELVERFAARAVDVARAGLRSSPPDLVLLSLPVLDAVDRRTLLVDPRQVGYRQELATRLAAARREVWRALDRQIARLLADVDLGTTAVFLVSGYANVPIHSEVDVREALRSAPGLAELTGRSDRSAYAITADGGVAHLRLSVAGRDSGGLLEPALARRLARRTRDALEGVRDGGQPVFERVLLRSQAKRWGLNVPASGDVIAFARPGYRLMAATPDVVVVARRAGELAAPGFAASDPASQGVYLAVGSGVRQRRLGTPPRVTEVAARVARAIGVPPLGGKR